MLPTQLRALDLSELPPKLKLIAVRRMEWLYEMALPHQVPPVDDWRTWVLRSGRGAGKTRTAAEETVFRVATVDGFRAGVVAPTFSAARDICIEGESGIRTVAEEYGLEFRWNRSHGQMVFENDSRIDVYSAERPERLRGPQHHWLWWEELAVFNDAWRGDVVDTSYNNGMLGLRLGQDPRNIVTTTPRSVLLLREILDREGTAVTVGSTMDNAANLATSYLEEIQRQYEGTRLARQEIYGEMLDDIEGALWGRDMIHYWDQHSEALPEFVNIAIGVDPATTTKRRSNETGIVVAGITADFRFMVLDDFSIKGSPYAWANAVADAFREYDAGTIIVESNAGGDLLVANLAAIDESMPVRTTPARESKENRAQRVVNYYEQGKVLHRAQFHTLEDQMCSWVPGEGESPDRVDALVWAMSALAARGPSTHRSGSTARGRRIRIGRPDGGRRRPLGQIRSGFRT